MLSSELLSLEVVGSLSVLLLIASVFYRRFRRATAQVPRACHAAAAIAVTLGVATALGGVGHSVAVGSLALTEGEYGPLQILRFTTGALLMYSGAVSVGLFQAIKAGRRSAVTVAIGTSLMLWIYLVFLFPLPGISGEPMLVMWSVFLLFLCAAFLAGRREDGRSRLFFAADPG